MWGVGQGWWELPPTSLQLVALGLITPLHGWGDQSPPDHSPSCPWGGGEGGGEWVGRGIGGAWGLQGGSLGDVHIAPLLQPTNPH